MSRPKCEYFVERKKRFCKFEAMPGHKFCGNHFNCSVEGSQKRVVCPFDPTGGHTVLESEVEKHKAKCPAYKLLMQQKAQPYYREGINSGVGPGRVLPQASPEFADRKGRIDIDSARRACYASGLGEAAFMQLLQRIDVAYQQLCCGDQPMSVVTPPEANPFLREGGDSARPFSLKHALQQASIVGNMKKAGLLSRADESTFVEFGAGKGYLSSMLSDCCPSARRLVMVDRRGFMRKADRSMRHLEMQRLRCDIADFEAQGVPGLEGGARSWVGLGKHLCGAATDFTLRCCARSAQREGRTKGGVHGDEGELGTDTARDPGDCHVDDCSPARAGDHAEPAVGSETGGARLEAGAGGGCRPGGGPGGLLGLAVATCCHHRCNWRHLVGKGVFVKAGFSPQEFELISWMTGWALCGHEAPAGCGGGEGGGNEGVVGGVERGHAENAGVQLAGGDGVELPRGGADLGGISTSCGSGQQGLGTARPACSAGARDDDLPSGQGGGQGSGNGRPCKRQQVGAPCSRSGEQKRMTLGTCDDQAACESVCMSGREVEEGGLGILARWRPHHSLPRAERIAVGQKCKRLIDAARALWLREQGFKAGIVSYVAPEVSGENQLLLAIPYHATAGYDAACGAALPTCDCFQYPTQ